MDLLRGDGTERQTERVSAQGVICHGGAGSGSDQQDGDGEVKPYGRRGRLGIRRGRPERRGGYTLRPRGQKGCNEHHFGTRSLRRGDGSCLDGSGRREHAANGVHTYWCFTPIQRARVHCAAVRTAGMMGRTVGHMAGHRLTRTHAQMLDHRPDARHREDEDEQRRGEAICAREARHGCDLQKTTTFAPLAHLSSRKGSPDAATEDGTATTPGGCAV